MTKITIAHSPDSDDAFMFYGLASGNIDTGGIVVEQVLSDIETLNRAAFEGKYEVTAVSFHAYAHLVDKYALLPHGASMGDKYGPIVVAPAITPREPGEPEIKAVKGTPHCHSGDAHHCLSDAALVRARLPVRRSFPSIRFSRRCSGGRRRRASSSTKVS